MVYAQCNCRIIVSCRSEEQLQSQIGLEVMDVQEWVRLFGGGWSRKHSTDLQQAQLIVIIVLDIYF